MYILSMIVLIFFAVIGFCSFITSLADAGFHRGSKMTLILDRLTAEDAEIRIRRAAHICRKYGGIRAVCLCAKDAPAYDICCLMQRDYPFIEILSSTEEIGTAP